MFGAVSNNAYTTAVPAFRSSALGQLPAAIRQPLSNRI